VRRHSLDARGESLGALELYYAEGAPPDADLDALIAECARTLGAALGQAVAIAELQVVTADLERRARERTGEAVRAERMVAIGTLAQGVVAELERPLGAVYAHLRSIIEDIDRETYRQGGRAPLPRATADKIRDLCGDAFLEVEHIARLAKDLRRLAPSEQSAKVGADVNLLVESALNLARHRLHPNAEVQTDYGALPEIACYPDRLVQAFANLLVNAAEAVRGRGEIFVRTARRDERIVVEVSDSGIGIAEPDVARIFDPFFTTKRSNDGPGLGLAIVREVVTEHGGEVTVESAPGEGTRFEILLPVS
jgi:signal transduction histidine kinase